MRILSAIAEDGIEAASVALNWPEANTIGDDDVLNALNRFKPQPSVEVLETPKRLKLKDERRRGAKRRPNL